MRVVPRETANSPVPRVVVSFDNCNRGRVFYCVMTELISPTQANVAIFIISILLVLIGGVCGYRRYEIRGFALCLPGVLVMPLWQVHLWLTRYDSHTNVLGLTSVKVLLGEFLLFAILGMVIGWFFSFALRAPTGNSSRQANGE